MPSAFSPPEYAVWTNSFWFLNLTISITSGLLDTLLQQWARQYIKITQGKLGQLVIDLTRRSTSYAPKVNFLDADRTWDFESLLCRW